MKYLKIYSDGAARGNPGPAGAGWVIRDAKGNVLSEMYRYLGDLTNNQAEYRALILALTEALHLKPEGVTIHLDSELLVRQLNGQYKVKSADLKPLFQKVVLTLGQFGSYSVKHVPREENREADRLANQAIDKQFSL